MEILSRGAEALLTTDGETVVKERLPKKYRHPTLDVQLRKRRTKREASILRQLPVAGPRLLKVDGDRIEMSFIPGQQLKTLLDQNPWLAADVGGAVARLHDASFIHGDLTTSNMIHNGALNLIDFGLSFTSTSAEDKAVDLHLFKQALVSRHHAVADEAFRYFLKGYSMSPHAGEVMARFKAVERRGRNKGKY